MPANRSYKINVTFRDNSSEEYVVDKYIWEQSVLLLFFEHTMKIIPYDCVKVITADRKD